MTKNTKGLPEMQNKHYTKKLIIAVIMTDILLMAGCGPKRPEYKNPIGNT
jgi:hypothetical protein